MKGIKYKALDVNLQKGIIHLSLILIAVVGIIAFMLISSTAPFKNNLLSTLFPKQSTHAATPTDWNQVGKDPQRTGFSSETLGTNFKVKCTYAFQPERVDPITQAIIYSGLAFVGTEMGNMYGIDALTCAKKWSYQTNGPILNSAAADNGKVYFGSMDGAVYALNTSDGSLAWKQQLTQNKGFSTAPLLVNNKVIIGGRDGKFYALDPASGSKIWEYNAGAPILMTAAASADGSKAYFGSMDMYVHAVNTANGTQVWKSKQIPGAAFKDYWPVVTQGKVIVRPQVRNPYNAGITPGTPFSWWTSTLTIPGTTLNVWQWLTNNSQALISGNASTVPEFMSVQDTTMANPNTAKQGVFILDETDGVERTLIPHFEYQSLTGTVTPPCIDKDGYLIMPLMFITSGWGRLDLATKRYVDVLFDGVAYNGQPVSSSNSYARGFGNGDENLNPTCTANMVLGFHSMETNANYTGYFNFATRTWTGVGPGYKNQQISNNNQGPSNPVSVSNGNVYHVSIHELIVRSTN